MRSPMFVRRAGGADVPTMYRIYNSNLDDYFAPENIEFFMLQWPRGQLMAETLTGIPAGALSSYILEDGTASIALLAVNGPFQGMGAGTMLIDSLRAECFREGIWKIQLEARVSNSRAINLYERLGFRRTEVLPSLYSDGMDGIRLVLELTHP